MCVCVCVCSLEPVVHLSMLDFFFLIFRISRYSISVDSVLFFKFISNFLLGVKDACHSRKLYYNKRLGTGTMGR